MKTEINELLDSSFKEYADYVNFNRAIPHFFDGLKPVQRRILYTMYENRWLSSKPFVKVSRISGQVMGIYHPHGNTSIEGALVRMAQSYHNPIPLIQGEGNYGDGLEQGAAAARYIEARLSVQGDKFFHAIEKETVPWQLNYDSSTQEPVYLPVPYPNLLAFPTLGIGVGKMVSIPSHNLSDLINTTKFALENDHFTTEELLKRLKGPDFSCGCEVVNANDLVSIYKNGKGSFRLRAKFEWQGNTLIISNFPYGVSASKVEKEIVDNHVLFDYCDIVNTTAKRQELRLMFRNQDNEYIKNLCWNTSAENTFSFQFRAIEGDKAKIFSLQEFFMKWKKEYLSLMLKEFKFDISKLQHKEEQLLGIIKALDIIDLVIKWIRESANKSAARAKLIEEGFSEVQANYILDLKLSKLANAEVKEVASDLEKIQEQIAGLKKLIENPSVLKSEALNRISNQSVNTERKSQIKEQLFIKPKKVESTTFYIRQKGGIVLITDDHIKNAIMGSKESPVYVATQDNYIVPIKSPKDSAGKGIILDGNSPLIHVSEDGLVKKTSPKEYSVSRKAKASGQKKVHSIFQGEGWLVFTSSSGDQAQFSTEEIAETGRNAKGVIGVKGKFDKVEFVKEPLKGVRNKRRHLLT